MLTVLAINSRKHTQHDLAPVLPTHTAVCHGRQTFELVMLKMETSQVRPPGQLALPNSLHDRMQKFQKPLCCSYNVSTAYVLKNKMLAAAALFRGTKARYCHCQGGDQPH